MLRKAKVEPVVPCAVCAAPSTGTVWDARLCDGCHARWSAETKPFSQLELAHADAHPEDVEFRGELQFPADGQEKRWVILKLSASNRIARVEALRWLMQAQADQRRSA